ncbi:PucR family transcriptional regulator [Rhodococcus sp. NPDC127528]|uniref:PucR family transcriptional regulator n=1 Tax=unclassified Rhodococcus (in: high G+C Gram-positive bacteria) TaxID=192944 RepID=UPI00363B4355
MSGDKSGGAGPVVLSGRPLADQLAQRTHHLVAATVRAVRTEVPFYRSLPDEAVRTDVTTIIRRNLELFIAALRANRTPEAAELAALSRSAGRRAEELVPMADVLRAYHIGVEHWWEAITALAAEGDGPALARAGRLLHSYLLAATTAVLSGYGADRSPPREDDAALRSLFAALTSGSGAESAADEYGLTLPRLYWVVVMHVAPHPDEAAVDVDTAVAQRRKARRLLGELDALGRDRALTAIGAAGGTALVPIVESEPSESDWADSPEYLQLRRSLAGIERILDTSMVCAVDVAAPAQVPDALARARDVLDVARRYGRRSGAVAMRDVAVEYQLTRPSAATTILANALSPLDSHEDVRLTFEAYLDVGCDRTATAAVLHVHPNTVAYRLRKAAALTGLDLSTPASLLRAAAALAARRSTSHLP